MMTTMIQEIKDLKMWGDVFQVYELEDSTSLRSTQLDLQI